MGFFKDTKNAWKMAEAAGIIQAMLEHQQRTGMFTMDPAKMANVMVAAVWNNSPETFDGRRGARPHKATLAAAALIAPIRGAAEQDRVDPNIGALAVCLAQILGEFGEKGHLYNLNNLDEVIITSVIEQFEEVQSKLYDLIAEDAEVLEKFGL